MFAFFWGLGSFVPPEILKCIVYFIVKIVIQLTDNIITIEIHTYQTIKSVFKLSKTYRIINWTDQF